LAGIEILLYEYCRKNYRATVDYAVFAPGMFNNSVLLGLPNDPSNDTQFVYAYQIILADKGTWTRAPISL